MNNVPSDSLTREKIQQLLAAVGSNAAPQTEHVQAADYSFRQPHYFSRAQLKKLDKFAEKLAARIADKFSALYHSDFNITVASVSQQFAQQLLAEDPNEKLGRYCLTFAADNRLCGFVDVPSKTALSWATQLLGETSADENTNRDLSDLEESLLLSITLSIVAAISDAGDKSAFRPNAALSRSILNLELDAAEQWCKISFNVAKTGSEKTAQAHLFIISTVLELIIDPNKQSDNKFSDKDITKAVLDRLHQVSVCLEARLSSTMLTFEEIAAMQPEDVLLLDKKINEPLELTLAGRTVFYGLPVKSAGKYAVLVTQSAKNASQK
jgi:flagellar motor switch protein FliM